MCMRHTDSVVPNTQCRLKEWAPWAVARGPHANLYMFVGMFFLMFKH